MRPFGLGLLAAFMVALAAPAAALAAPAAKAPTVDKAQREAGMKEAPAVVQAAGLNCQVSDARKAGTAPPDKKTGSPGGSVYEVACGEGSIGYLIQTSGTNPPTVFSCILANYPGDMKPPTSPCILPANENLMPAVQKLAANAKTPCVPDKVRGIGQTATQTVVEVSCPGGSGYIIMASAPLDVSKGGQAQNCLGYDAATTNIKCELNPAAARVAVEDKFAGAANVGCTVKDRRYIGLLTDGTEGYEFACQDGKGYVVKVNAQGAIASSIDCSKLVGGGCQLTDTRAAQAEQAGLYTKLAKNAGSNCAVERYAVFPAKGDEEVVELVCQGGNGAIGMFPATGKGTVLDCGHALLAGYKCSLGKADYTALTDDLKKFDKKDCQVSQVGAPLKGADGSMRLEVACADGLPGYMITYTSPSSPKEAIGCTFAGNCTLPTNKKKG
jgi:hypothetical protein